MCVSAETSAQVAECPRLQFPAARASFPQNARPFEDRMSRESDDGIGSEQKVHITKCLYGSRSMEELKLGFTFVANPLSISGPRRRRPRALPGAKKPFELVLLDHISAEDFAKRAS
jgi:hypothetical protein